MTNLVYVVIAIFVCVEIDRVLKSVIKQLEKNVRRKNNNEKV